jgi:crotonobetainyl-CoA:carnitine CoA-transferase CaiB-like acyl-CoA transferase
VLELADEQGEFCGRLLANLGAGVIKVEPPGGSPTREIGPFLGDEPDPEKSLYFWHYNLGKRSVSLDLETAEGQLAFKELARSADVVLETTPKGYLEARGLGYDELSVDHAGLVFASISPFGRSGPWADFHGSDLVHLALGGQMMYCGYDPDINGDYDTPPIAGQMWQAYHMASDHATIGVLAALLNRDITGLGQRVDVPIHQVVATNTETDVPQWIYARNPTNRSTTRAAPTKDGRFLYTFYFPLVGSAGHDRQVAFLDSYGMAGDLADEKYKDADYRAVPDVDTHLNAFVSRFIKRYKFEGPWHEAQKAGLLWVPMRKPEENLGDPHYSERQTFAEVDHPELGQSFRYPVGRWHSDQASWTAGPRAPFNGEHTAEVLAELSQQMGTE